MATTPALASVPRILVIVYGFQFAIERAAVFVRTLLSTRSGPLHLSVLGDADGLRGFRQVLYEHGSAIGLWSQSDVVSFVAADSSPLAVGYLHHVHPSCHAGGYAYLFLKALAADLFPVRPN